MAEVSIARSMRAQPYRAFMLVFSAILISTLPWLIAGSPARAQMPAPTPTANNLIEGLSQSASSIGDSADALASHPEAAALLNSDEFRWLRANPEAQLTGDEYRQLCAAIAAKHISPQDIQSLGPALGLSSQQLAQVTSCSSAQPAQSYAASPMNARPAAGAGAPTPSYISSIEARFHDLDTPYKLLSQPSTQQLSQFGYELFSSKVSTFAPAENAPVSDDYVLGPGDTINVLLWGRINQTFSLQVQRDGTILMPEIGPIEVSGLTFGQTKKLIEHRGSEITGLQVDVTMGQVRAIQVFVIGKVAQSGLYTVSSLSHVSNALVAAGGIGKVGSLRDIQLRRENHLIGTLDLYGLLLKGDTSGDLSLKPRDVIFVPVIGPVAAVTGDVRDPSIYELSKNETLGSVLKMAGGVTAFGYAERVQVERVENHQRRVALDLNLNDDAAAMYPVKDGDLIKVFTVLPRERNVVKAQGNVNQPGRYQWYPGMRVADLVREAQEVSDHTFFDYALVKRLEGPERKVHLIPFSLDGALSGPSDPSNLSLEPEDTLTIYNLKDIAEVPKVVVRGEVRKPGSYLLTPGMRVRDLVYEAGGLKDNAARDRAQLARTEVDSGSAAHYVRTDLDLRSALQDSQDNLTLKNGDELFVQQVSNWHPSWHVILKGEVMRPGPYAIHEGERLASVLRECGGFRTDAYPPAAVFIRQSVKNLQQDELDRARTRLQEEVARLSVMPRQTGQADNIADAMMSLKSVLAQTEAQQATGRVSIDLSTLSALENSSDNIVLQADDTLVIPIQPSSVQVLGQVYNPNSIVSRPGLTVADYLQRAGGPTEGADRDHIYVIQANGSILTEEGVRLEDRNRLFPLLPAMSGGLMGTRLQAGDTVYVPEKLIYTNSLQYTKDITQIVTNSVESLAILGILATNL
jgi:protein involved in polysaccharide export with SLBB domain